jgi:hypothetical protein
VNTGHAARTLLLIGGVFSSAIAMLHVVIVFVGAPAYRYFGAGEDMAHLAEAGSWVPPLLTLAIALVFAVWASYGFSGAGLIRRLPLLRAALLTIGLIFSLRGLSIVPQVVALVQSDRSVMHRAVVFSLVSLTCGIIYLAGTTMLPRKDDAAPW